LVALAISTVLISKAQQETALALAQEEEARRQRTLAQVDALLNADPQAVPVLLAALEPTLTDVLPRLRQLWAQPEQPHSQVQRGRVALVLLPVEPEAVKVWLASWMLRATDPREIVLLRDALAPHAAGLKESLRAKAGKPGRASAASPSPAERFRALVALAAFDADSPRWQKAGDDVVELPWGNLSRLG